MSTLLSGLAGTHYIQTLDQYVGHAAPHFQASLFDEHRPPPDTPSMTAMVDEITRVLGTHHLHVQPSAIYLLYTSNAPKNASSVNFCAWHSWFHTEHATSAFAYLPNIPGSTSFARCTPDYGPETVTSRYSMPTRSLAESTIHEVAEAMTDPSDHGWFGAFGTEVGDLCRIKPMDQRAATVALGGPDNVWVLPTLWDNVGGRCAGG
jgi:hypothetical protein